MASLSTDSTSKNIGSRSRSFLKNLCVIPSGRVQGVTNFPFQTLYSGTIRFNILLGATKPISEVTQEEIEAACRDANILDFIQSLPE